MAASENNTGIRRIYNAFFYSVSGFKACFKTEEAFQQEVFLALIMVPLAFWLGDSAIEQLILIGSVFLVIIVELLNTAVERAIDRISFEKHELSKEAKDMGSAAVLTSLIFAGLAWALILLPKFI